MEGYFSRSRLTDFGKRPDKANSPNLDEMRPSLNCWQGRTEERQKIGEWMADGNIRLIGITGLGGFGKSTLAAKSMMTIALSLIKSSG
jgi:hypothetical protein